MGLFIVLEDEQTALGVRRRKWQILVLTYKKHDLKDRINQKHTFQIGSKLFRF